ncbi:MAG: D-alanyl-D-alanine carboxypeptidase [Oscillospiraceae bacterium]|jgi:D-alanyl-D-alanine carboxypeptidase/D-alanyl-D-alanine carboxypeptidase (penicillin-binding protein 5/6)|nr:D-alanyl-D-alanine carboxypeptidase [Oscillospiraceae bacterium]
MSLNTACFRRRAAGLLLSALLLAGFFVNAGALTLAQSPMATPSLSAQSAILIDAADGQVFFARNADREMPMASTTKIMTALLLLEAGGAEEIFTVTKEMVTVEGTSMGLLPGNQVSRYALACGMLLASGNDAANAAAYWMDGSLPAFARRMNERAAALGMAHTYFVTPSGLDTQGHYSTASDMALLARVALQNPAFREICGRRTVRVAFGSPPYLRTITNHNKLLGTLEGCIGVKTGFTKKSGRCLISAAERNGVTLIAVTLNAPDDWEDHRRLYDFGFSLFHPIPLEDGGGNILLPVVGGKAGVLRLQPAWVPVAQLRSFPDNIRREILMRPFEYAPLDKGGVLGLARYYTGTRLLAEVPLVAENSVAQRTAQAAQKLSLWQRILRFFRKD